MTSLETTNSAAPKGHLTPVVQPGAADAIGPSEVAIALLAERKRVHAIIAAGKRLQLHSNTIQEAILRGVSAEGFITTFEVEATARAIIEAAS